MTLEYRLSSSQISPFLKGVIDSMGLGPNELHPPMEQWGRYYLGEMPGMFRRSGRGDVHWPRLAASTRASYRAKGIQGALPLFRTGEILHSIKAGAVSGFGTSELRVSSDDWLAKLHHHGALIPAHTIVPKNAKALRFRSGGAWVFAKKVNIPFTEIPERPILFITAQDQAKAETILRTYLLKKMTNWRPNPTVSAEAFA